MSITIDVPDGDRLDKAHLEATVDAEIAAFEAYFTQHVDPSGGAHLHPVERAILKTYFWWRLHVAPTTPRETTGL